MTDPGSSDRRERMVAAVLAGEVAPSAAEVQALRASDPEFAAELDRLLPVQARLSVRAAEMREDLAVSDPELEDAAELAARRLPGSQARTRRTALRWAAAAAVLLAATWWWRPWPGPIPPQILGGLPVRISEDQSELRIVWSLAPGQHFEVRVLDSKGEPVQARQRFDEPRWRPSPSLVASWSVGWLVEVRVVSSEGDVPSPTRVEHWSPARQK